MHRTSLVSIVVHGFIQIHPSFRDLLAKTTFQIVTIIGGSPIINHGSKTPGHIQSVADYDSRRVGIGRHRLVMHRSRSIMYSERIIVMCFCHNSYCLPYIKFIDRSPFSETVSQHARHAIFSDINILQGSVATCLRCGRIFNDRSVKRICFTSNHDQNLNLLTFTNFIKHLRLFREILLGNK